MRTLGRFLLGASAILWSVAVANAQAEKSITYQLCTQSLLYHWSGDTGTLLSVSFEGRSEDNRIVGSVQFGGSRSSGQVFIKEPSTAQDATVVQLKVPRLRPEAMIEAFNDPRPLALRIDYQDLPDLEGWRKLDSYSMELQRKSAECSPNP